MREAKPVAAKIKAAIETTFYVDSRPHVHPRPAHQGERTLQPILFTSRPTKARHRADPSQHTWLMEQWLYEEMWSIN